MKKNQNGFSAIETVIILLVLGLIGFVGWKVISRSTDHASTNSTSKNTASKQSAEPEQLIWQQTAEGWRSTQTPPSCPSQPMLKMPANISNVTSILYPGQTRGGNYKPHGGFRFDNATNNAVTVTAPLDGYIVRGSRYLADGTNEVQYTFDVMNNCGIMYRLGHLRELPTNLQKIVDTFPAATASSATERVNPAVYVKQGDTFATKVGIITDKNTFFDWGVFDYRQENEASKSDAYRAAHPQSELTWHAVCWLKEWLPAQDVAAIAKLPAGDPTSAKSSDYCK
jgi:type II secretory pathway pseudopilin PulG